MIVGRTRKVHGLKGEIVVELLTDNPDDVFEAGRQVYLGNARGAPQPEPIAIDAVRGFREAILVKLAGIDDRTAAERISGRLLFVPSTELRPPNEDEIYVHDLLGMRVERVTGDVVGTVIDIHELPQGLALEVGREG
ncbi:MAG TPA: ribosome maturation factor RimM, partial [Gemmatimonadaceae bacterium]